VKFVDVIDISLQRLEDSLLRDREDLTILGEDNKPAKLPARVREIITKHLPAEESGYTPPRMSTTPTVSQLEEENRLLAAELNRVEDLLAASRAERDELGIKYNAISDKVSCGRH
jgi:rootletin